MRCNGHLIRCCFCATVGKCLSFWNIKKCGYLILPHAIRLLSRIRVIAAKNMLTIQHNVVLAIHLTQLAAFSFSKQPHNKLAILSTEWCNTMALLTKSSYAIWIWCNWGDKNYFSNETPGFIKEKFLFYVSIIHSERR